MTIVMTYEDAAKHFAPSNTSTSQQWELADAKIMEDHKVKFSCRYSIDYDTKRDVYVAKFGTSDNFGKVKLSNEVAEVLLSKMGSMFPSLVYFKMENGVAVDAVLIMLR